MSFSDLPLFSRPETAAPPETVQKKPEVWTVTDLTKKIKGLLEPSFRDVLVRGELSNFRPSSSGHLYFSLKDSNAMLNAVFFGFGRKRLPYELKDGIEVLCHGKMGVYAPRGSYQIVVDSIEPLGAGALQLAFEQLKTKLASEGLFDPKRKRPLPGFPKRIAVVTSPGGAAIQDMFNILGRRAPHIEVNVVPAQVQGEGAHRQILRGLRLANQHRLGDLVVLARGGGSIEDLWCFNEESLAREIADSELPVISAVGHEIDFTISDFVSDLRAPTPSAAAEVVSEDWVNVSESLEDAQNRLALSMKKILFQRWELLNQVSARVQSPTDRLREKAQRLDELLLRLERGIRTRWERKAASFNQVVGQMNALSPLRVLERGYAIVRDGSKVIKSTKEVKGGMKMKIRFRDGECPVEAI